MAVVLAFACKRVVSLEGETIGSFPLAGVEEGEDLNSESEIIISFFNLSMGRHQ